MKTLKEVCNELGISRRVVQGYQEAGLVKATKKNKYGHLLYNQSAFEKIEDIRFLQEMKFSIKEIKTLINAPEDVFQQGLEKQIDFLEEELEKDQQTLEKAKKMVKEMKG